MKYNKTLKRNDLKPTDANAREGLVLKLHEPEYAGLNIAQRIIAALVKKYHTGEDLYLNGDALVILFALQKDSFARYVRTMKENKVIPANVYLR